MMNFNQQNYTEVKGTFNGYSYEVFFVSGGYRVGCVQLPIDKLPLVQNMSIYNKQSSYCLGIDTASNDSEQDFICVYFNCNGRDDLNDIPHANLYFLDVDVQQLLLDNRTKSMRATVKELDWCVSECKHIIIQSLVMK